MKKTELDWSKFPWEKFEELIVYLTQDAFDDPLIQRYLKQGNKQDGIDLISLRRNTGSHLCIQCKKTSEFYLSDLKEAEGEFIKGTFAGSTDTFILATSSDCQKKTIQQHYQIQAKLFLEDYNLNYQLWDKNTIETLLKNHFPIVQYYFGLIQARQHCFMPSPVLPKYQDIADYIPRFLLNINDINDNPFGRNTVPSLPLTDLLKQDIFQTKHICLLADAYEGKTSLLTHTAYELMESHSSIVPLLIILKDTTLRPIHELLREHYLAWESTPINNLVVMIDGLDEVAVDRFSDVINLIKDFTRSFPLVNLIFSCRKLFYSSYHLEKQLKFEYYQLQPIGYYYQDQYIGKKLGNQKEQLQKRIRQMDLDELMQNPFYLIQITKWFRTNPKLLPANKADITEKFIEESLEFSATRRLSGGQQLDGQRVAYKKVLQKFALSLQLAGLNAAPKEFVQELFSTQESELLQTSSIIVVSNNSWSFNNAMFQEQLAARQLISFPATQIIPMICTGHKIRKINTKWIQTIASYLSLLPLNHSDREVILKVINEDNIELITLADRSKFSPVFRLEIVQRIFERSAENNTRLLLVSEADLAEFTGNDDKISCYLISLVNMKISERIKVLACRTMKYLQFNEQQQQKLLLAVLKEFPQHKDFYFGKLLLQLLGIYQLQHKKLLPEIFRKIPRLEHHEFRDGIYRYLTSIGLIDQYYWFGIEGLESLVQYNTEINHHGSEADLEKFLLSTKKPANLIRLYEHMSTERWMQFYRHKSIRLEVYLDELCKLTVLLYKQRSGLMVHLIRFLMCADKRHVLKAFEKLFDFFDLTNTQHLGLQLYLQQKGGNGYHFHFGRLLSPESNQKLILMFEDGEIQRKELYSFMLGYRQLGQPEQADKFNGQIEQIFGKEAQLKSSHDTYAEIERIKNGNDSIHIASRDSFESALLAFFEFYKGKPVTSTQLNADPVKKTKRTPLESNYLLEFIRKCRDDQKRVTLKACIEKLSIPNLFETWRAYKLKSLDYKNNPNPVYQQNLEDFYKSEIGSTEFIDTLGKQTEETWYRKSFLLAELWQTYRYPTPEDKILEFTWMVTGGINALSTNKVNKRGSIAEALLDHFSGREEVLGRQIISNLLAGITKLEVETAHLELCKVLKLYEAVPILLEKINSGRYRTSDTSHMIAIYRKLNGAPENLVSVFKKLKPYENYLYRELVRILIEPCPEEVIPGLQKVLKDSSQGEEDKIGAATFLASAGEISGLNYLIDYLKAHKKPPTEIQSDNRIWNVDTKKALKKLSGVIYMVPDKRCHCEPFYRSPDRYILEILEKLAFKGEEDLLLVCEFYRRNAKKYQKDFPDTAKDLIWYSENAIENFRKNATYTPDIREIKALLKTLE
jgi:hypothetical protein